MNRRILILLALVLMAAVSTGAWWINRPAPAVQWQGYAEADFVKVGPTQQGMLTDVLVTRGDHVKQGQPLFDQDPANDRAARDQAQRQLDQATQQLANLKAPGRDTEITQAEANLADAQATRVRMEADLKRIEEVLDHGAASIQSRDQAQADLLSQDAKIRGLQAALEQMRDTMGRPDEITAQEAAVQAAKAAVAMADWKLSQRHMTAPADAVVADVMAWPGETMAAGAPVVSLLPPGNIFVRFFVPEPMLAQMHYGDKVALSFDGGPANLVGTISFISPQAEYTPPVIYSDESRAKLVYEIEARPAPDQATLFNPGEPVVVRPTPAGKSP